jgi:superfamily I DNA/RNA helicase
MISLSNGVTSIRGVAGGRKTQLIADLAFEHPDKKFLYLSYGRANAEAVKSRFSNNVDVHTYHSYIHKHFTDKMVTLHIVDKITQAELDMSYVAMNGNEYAVVDDKRLAPYIAAVLNYFSTNPGPIGSAKAALTPYKKDLPHEDMVNIMKAASIYVKHALRNEAALTHEMYLKLGLREDLRDNPYDIIVSDEHQDTSKTMQSVLMALDPLGEKCVIKLGDPLQMIFQHLGAELDNDLINPTHQFNKTFRCGANVTKLANDISMPHYRKYGMAEMIPAGHDDEVVTYAENTLTPMERGAILHYHNASVIAHAIDLTLEGIPITIDSASLRKGLNVYSKIIERAKRSRIGFHREIDIILRRAVSGGERDTVIAARVISKMSNELNKLTSVLGQLGEKAKNPKYLLATIHFMKGQTFKQVTLGNDVTTLNPANRYHANVLYTGITRASDKLFVPKGLWNKLKESVEKEK